MDEYPVIITRRRTSRLSIRVTKDGEVRVSAPRLVPRRVINEFVASHREWIEKALERVGRQREGREAFYGQLDVSTPALRKAAAARLAAIVEPMVQQHAAALEAELAGGQVGGVRGGTSGGASGGLAGGSVGVARGGTSGCASGESSGGTRASATSVTPSGISYRCTRTRWGSCNPRTRHINFSTYLLLLPDWCIEHVVVHELCHLLVPDHSPRFYALMDRHFPLWKEALSHTRLLVTCR